MIVDTLNGTIEVPDRKAEKAGKRHRPPRKNVNAVPVLADSRDEYESGEARESTSVVIRQGYNTGAETRPHGQPVSQDSRRRRSKLCGRCGEFPALPCSKIYKGKRYHSFRFCSRCEAIRKRGQKSSSSRHKIPTANSWENPKYRASVTLRDAVRNGKINKPEWCDRCGNSFPLDKIHGHHSDYSKPLEVMWLCFVCHAAEHRKYKSGGVQSFSRKGQRGHCHIDLGLAIMGTVEYQELRHKWGRHLRLQVCPTTEEIASVCGCSKQRIDQIYQRALRRLRNHGGPMLRELIETLVN